jgi:hypothetical protein
VFITLEYHRNPLRLELVRHVLPLCLFLVFLATGLGYAWARTVYSNFQCVKVEPISLTMKLKENQLMNHHSGEGRNPAGAVFSRP